jgi:hypothetical protein
VKWFGHTFHMSVAYYQANIIIIKNAIILKIIHNVVNLCDTEVVICIILVLLKKRDKSR